MSSNQLLDITVNARTVDATIGRRTLLGFLKTYENWPVNEDTHKPLKIVDKELFLDELVAHLMEEDERGLTPIHRAFEEALVNLLESGTEAIESPDSYDESVESLDFGDEY